MNTAVFLLAGRGSRLNRYTEIIPKCLVEVSGKPILHRMLALLLMKGIKKVVLVVGYRWEDIYKSIGDNWHGINIQYVNNIDWEKTNNIVSFYMAKDLIDEDFLLIEGDIVVAPNALDHFQIGKNQMAVSAFMPFMDGTVVTFDKPLMMVDRIYLKPDYSQIKRMDETYKTVNIYSIKHSDFTKLVIPELKKIIDSGKVNSYYEQAFASLVNNGDMQFEAIDYSNLKWFEIDNEEDLEMAEKIFS